LLLDDDLGDQAQDIVVSHVVEWPHIFFFEAFAQILGGDKTRFAVRQVTPSFIAELHERRVRQSHNMGLAIDKKLRVNRVRVACGDAVPQMRKAALIRLPAQFGSDFKRADELAHRAGIGKYWECRHALSF
jgi:hypothetical protein